MNWHETTDEEKKGTDQNYLIDIQPDVVNYMAANDGDALIRLCKSGWSWIIRTDLDKAVISDAGEADTKEAAIGDALAALAKLRERIQAEAAQKEEESSKKKGWFR